MRRAVVTGSAGLIGSEACRQLASRGFHVWGVDNDMRKYFFGPDGSTQATTYDLLEELRAAFHWRRFDIRDGERMTSLMEEITPEIVVHCAAQPSHDWAAREPMTDFGVNAVGTLNVLEATRLHAPAATVIHCSTSKVYGDNPNRLPLRRPRGTDRLDLVQSHRFYDGITPDMSIDQCLHSLFGASKASADLVAQEYGRYFGMKVGVFRPGCLTGADHAGVELHGFLAYLGKCVARDLPYKIFGYDGLQVRCNIHAQDLVSAFLAYHDGPHGHKVYNIGGGRDNACSMVEAIGAFTRLTGNEGWRPKYDPEPRTGDHRWWVSSNRQFEGDHPGWRMSRSLVSIYEEIAGRYS